ncbi:MAG: STAS domain-containing protein [Pseudomonadota bacterium]
MRFTSEQVGGAIVMTLGERRLDGLVAPEFRDAVREAVRPDCNLYILDLSTVGFVDSAGVGALVGLLKFLGRERKMELCGLKPTVRKIFRLTRLERVFAIRDSKAACLAAAEVAQKAAS